MHPHFPCKFSETVDAEDPARAAPRHARPMVRKQYEGTIEKTLDHQTLGYSKKNRRTEFLIQCKDKHEHNTTWEKGVQLWQFEDQIKAYLDSASSRATSSSGWGSLLPLDLNNHTWHEHDKGFT